MTEAVFFKEVEEIKPAKLGRFVLPTYLTSLFNTVYTIVCGIFVAAYVGSNTLAAINLVYPLVNILTAVALAFGAGAAPWRLIFPRRRPWPCSPRGAVYDLAVKGMRLYGLAPFSKKPSVYRKQNSSRKLINKRIVVDSG